MRPFISFMSSPIGNMPPPESVTGRVKTNSFKTLAALSENMRMV